ncbi:gag protease polyprotein [Cucumis melo var. makuwa]|uniref:Gag protease polyprotein n=1 Tax=Cucumis melo var. makuwa TaxID=1194695 RepID=A0A5A7SRB4_CUCMM|nr:gag protease polyprotein [Cucumis melo var. makuwa]TYK04644.1 gag protease polyprotein [Cucumis melo var. makuwa]
MPFFFFFSSASSLDERSRHPRAFVVRHLRIRTSPTESPNRRSTVCSRRLSLSSSPPLPAVSPSSSRVPDADRTPRGAALFRRRCRVEKGFEPEPRIEADPSRIRELTLKFLGFVAGLFRGNVTASCSLCAIGCKELFTDRHRYPGVLYIVVMLMGYVMDWNCVSFEITRLIRVSFGITRLICASFGITRLIDASFGITRLIRAPFGVKVQRGADRREARRMREGHMDASSFLYASADSEKLGRYSWYQSLSFRFCRLTYDVSLCFVSLWLKRSLPLVRETPTRRGARKGGRRGRGREAGRVQPEVQPVAQATDLATLVTHADLAAMEQRFRDLIMQMREQQQQPAPPALAPAPAPVPVVPQVVPDQLSAEAKHLRDFRKYNPTTFDGSMEDPTRAQLWLSSLETIFRYMKCPEDQKVQCAVFMLTDRGTSWWETTERMLGGDEFLNIEQGDMTVEQYDAEFDMLSRFGPEMIAIEAARADKFVRGLRLDIKGLKRKAEQQPIPVPQRNFRPGGEFRRFQQKPFEAGEAARRKPLCTTCGKHHLGRCLFGTRTCFKCRQEGHTADRCPMRITGNAQNQGAGAPHQGKVFATNKTEAERAGIVVIGTLPVLGHYALVLFDSGLSHSFISSAFVLHARLEVESLHHVLSVSTPSGECMLSKEKVKACQIEIAGHVIEVTLLVLDMLDFDVILSMDWLAANHASIDCSRKEVAFNPPSMASFKFKGEGSRSLPQVISAIRASKLLSQGTWGILASVVDTREVDVSLSSEPVVRDYLDVFPEELPGLPPHRDVEFAIELEPGTIPISRAPHRMALAELKELKV